MADWRLRGPRGSTRLVDAARYRPAVDGVFGYGSLDTWSSTSYSSSRTQAWYVGFESGSVSYGDRGGAVHCPRVVLGGRCSVIPTKHLPAITECPVLATVSLPVCESVTGGKGIASLTRRHAPCQFLDP